MDNAARLQRAFAEGLGLDPASRDLDTLTYGNPGWDSMAHMALITAIEREFDVMLETNDVIEMSSVAKAKEILGRHGIEFDADG
ncbi:MAG: acyl carrier protein [bacterium]